MNIRMLELLQPDEAQVVHRDVTPLVVRQSRLQLEPEQDVAPHIEPGEQGRFLEHDKPLLARAGYALPISQNLTALGLGQARHDVEERGLATTAWTEKTDKFAIQHDQRHILQCLDGGPFGQEALGDALDNELWLGRFGLDEVKRHSTLSTKRVIRRVRSGIGAGTNLRSSRGETARSCLQALYLASTVLQKQMGHL